MRRQRENKREKKKKKSYLTEFHFSTILDELADALTHITNINCANCSQANSLGVITPTLFIS